MIIGIQLLLLACSDEIPVGENHKELRSTYEETSPKSEIIDPAMEVLIEQSLQNTHGYDRLVALCDDIGHRISRVGNKSFDFISGIFHTHNKNLICSAIFKLVAYNYKEMRTIPVPSLITERCRPFE